MTAPILPDYVCRVCGAESIQQPWDAADGYVCANCGATNHPPLLPKGAPPWRVPAQWSRA